MSTIELVDPALRDALPQQLPPLTAESLTQRRSNALELAGAVPKPNLPDIATDARTISQYLQGRISHFETAGKHLLGIEGEPRFV